MQQPKFADWESSCGTLYSCVWFADSDSNYGILYSEVERSPCCGLSLNELSAINSEEGKNGG